MSIRPIVDVPARLLDALMRPEPVAAVPVVRLVGGHTPYGAAALDGEANTVRGAVEGQRNTTLNDASFRCGQLVGGGELYHVDAEEVLVGAALACGLPQAEAIRTVQRGLRDGSGWPRSAPERIGSFSPPVAPLTAGGKGQGKAKPDTAKSQPEDAPTLEQEVGGAGWEPVNLGRLGFRDKIRPTLGGVGLVYPSTHHVFSGPPEAAKTIVVYAIALEEIRSGGTVILIDFEMGEWEARDRLREMGATDEEFERLHYVAPDTPATETVIAALIDLNPSLVIIDAAAGAYGLQGLDDNVRKDAERFSALYIRAFRKNGIATIVIDHVVKNADNRGGYAIGSERKTGGADVHLGFTTIAPLSRGGTGRFKITTHKDRHGHLKRGHVADLELHSDPDTHAITWTFIPTQGNDATDTNG